MAIFAVYEKSAKIYVRQYLAFSTFTYTQLTRGSDKKVKLMSEIFFTDPLNYTWWHLFESSHEAILIAAKIYIVY